jgi:hypothetical protein
MLTKANTGRSQQFPIYDIDLDETNTAPGTLLFLNHKVSFHEAKRIDMEAEEEQLRKHLWPGTPVVTYKGGMRLAWCIQYSCSFGDIRRNVELTMASGGELQCYHVKIDKFYQGRIDWRSDEWCNIDDKFDTGDFEALVELIEFYRKPQYA